MRLIEDDVINASNDVINQTYLGGGKYAQATENGTWSGVTDGALCKLEQSLDKENWNQLR